MSVLDRMEEAWSGNLKLLSASTEPTTPFSPRTASLSSASALTVTPVDSLSSSPTGSLPGADPVGVQMTLAQQPLRRAVHKIQPLESFNAKCILAAEEEGPLRVLHFTKPAPFGREPLAFKPTLKRFAGSSTIPIPGIRADDDDLERRTSLIKAVKPDKIRPQIVGGLRQALGPSAAAELPTGSWTQRQIHFPLDEPAKQPQGLHRTLKARSAAIKARAAKQAKINTTRETTAEEVAWRFRFKKKWIREELFARKMEFPDDPGYEDEWEDAQKLIETCGYAGALQAAFLELPAKTSSDLGDEEFDFENADSLLFGDEYSSADEGSEASSRSSSASSEVAAKAATLVRLHRQASAARDVF